MNVDKWLNKVHIPDVYTCVEFTRDVWLDFTGEDLTERFSGLLRALKDRRLAPTLHRQFRRLQAPESPCLVVMTQLGRDPHLGVYFDGFMLHLNTKGAECFPLEIAGRGFTSFKYYK